MSLDIGKQNTVGASTKREDDCNVRSLPESKSQHRPSRILPMLHRAILDCFDGTFYVGLCFTVPGEKRRTRKRRNRSVTRRNRVPIFCLSFRIPRRTQGVQIFSTHVRGLCVTPISKTKKKINAIKDPYLTQRTNNTRWTETRRR